MVVYTDIEELMTMKRALAKGARFIEDKDLSLIPKAALVIDRGVVKWVGPQVRLPGAYRQAPKKSLEGLFVFPGFVDCHTHLVFSGDRRSEFELRNQGVSYQEVARRGGGILSTVEATRKASLGELISVAQKRVDVHLSQGVTTIEVKSGYGLRSRDEFKILKAALALRKANVITTFLGAHALPQEFKSRAKYYLNQLSRDLREIQESNLSRRVDIFIEKGYFSCTQARPYLKKAKDMGFDICIHGHQMGPGRAVELALELGALSLDHGVYLTSNQVKKLAQSETTAVLLPCADFYLSSPYPPARQILKQGGRVALATDFNPGSSPTQSFALLGLLSRIQMKMKLSEVFVALTLGGAYALGLSQRVGALVPGFQGDFFTSSQRWTEFFYEGSLQVEQTYVKGKRISKVPGRD